MNEHLDVRWYVEEGFGNPFESAPQTKDKLMINAAITGNVPTKGSPTFG